MPGTNCGGSSDLPELANPRRLPWHQEGPRDQSEALSREERVVEASAWRVNDVVAYELMREAATTLTHLLLQSIERDPATAAEVHREVAELRREVLSADGYDRAAVIALSTRIDSRLQELSRAAS